MNIREERVNNDLFLVIRLFWVKFFPRPMWRVQAGVKGWYITCYLSSGKPPWRNVFFWASFYILLTWCQLHPWLYDEGGWPEIINLSIKIKERSSNIHYLCKKVELIVFTEKIQKLWVVIGSKNKLKKFWKKLWLVYVAVPLPVPGCQRLSGILQFIFVREHLPIVIFYFFYLYLYL